MRSATSCERRGSGSSEGGVSRTDGGSRHPTREAPGARGGAGARERETYLRVARLGAVKHEEGAPVAIHLYGGVGVRLAQPTNWQPPATRLPGRARFPPALLCDARRDMCRDLTARSEKSHVRIISLFSHKHFCCQTTRPANSLQIRSYFRKKKCGSKHSERRVGHLGRSPGEKLEAGA